MKSMTTIFCYDNTWFIYITFITYNAFRIYLIGNFGDATDDRQVNMQEIKEFPKNKN